MMSQLAMLEFIEKTIERVEWRPIFDPDTHDLLGQVCYWCSRRPHTRTCQRQESLAMIKKLKDG